MRPHECFSKLNLTCKKTKKKKKERNITLITSLNQPDKQTKIIFRILKIGWVFLQTNYPLFKSEAHLPLPISIPVYFFLQ